MASPKIVQGEDRLLKVSIKTDGGVPYDLTGVTEITACFKLAAGGYQDVTMTLGAIAVTSPTGAGLIEITLTDTVTALLATGTQSFEVLVDIGTDRKIVQFAKALEIVKRICS